MGAQPATQDTNLPAVIPQEDAQLPAWMTRKVILVKQFMEFIPETDARLPEYFVRPDLLPCVESPQQMQQDEIEACKIRISYAQGYPTFEDTEQPIWFQAGYEPDEAFAAFEAYLDSVTSDGIRMLNDPNYTREQLAEWFYLYFWASRARAYDGSRSRANAHLASERRIETADDHYVKGKTLLQRAYEGLIDKELALNPREMVEVAKLGRDLTRGAIESTSSTARPRGTSVEIAVGQGVVVGNGRRLGDNLVDRALSDPETARVLQQVLVKLYIGGEESFPQDSDVIEGDYDNEDL